jgi:tRNA pseudouridine55 synthase
MSEIDGVLLVDKPEGPTSHDVVAMARRALRTKRVGHTGTLDPFASGLLILCLGPSTRLAEYLSGLPKSYSATIRLGVSTTTDDATGESIFTGDAGGVSRESLLEALATQVGEIDQLPPFFSAKKVDGERMYAAARRGERVERQPSRVTISSIDLVTFDPPIAEITVDCGSGTYIRSIARDIGEILGVGGHLTHLRRTRVGTFSVADAVPVSELADEVAVSGAFRPPSSAVSHLPSLALGDAEIAALRHGRAVPAADALPAGGPIALLGAAGELLAIGERIGDDVQPRKVFL